MRRVANRKSKTRATKSNKSKDLGAFLAPRGSRLVAREGGQTPERRKRERRVKPSRPRRQPSVFIGSSNARARDGRGRREERSRDAPCRRLTGTAADERRSGRRPRKRRELPAWERHTPMLSTRATECSVGCTIRKLRKYYRMCELNLVNYDQSGLAPPLSPAR